MLSEKISILVSSLHISISDIARAGGCSPSNLSRLRSGSRTPPQTSPTVTYLVKGIVALCREKGLTEQLSELTSIPISGTGEQDETALKHWLYEKGEVLDMPGSAASSAQLRDPVFGTRLDQLMKLAGMSNGELSRRSGLTPSYISRLRRGERMPKYSSKYLDGLCRVLLSEIYSSGNSAGFYNMTGIRDELPEDVRIQALQSWLFDRDAAASQAAVNDLLSTILSVGDSIPAAAGDVAVYAGDFSVYTDAEKKDLYMGTEGMRAATARFLSEALQNGSGDLLLYSDSDIGWMGGSFSPLLSYLMQSCIKKGMRISIIHNVDRSMPELIEAIRWWLPLYMTGRVTSYYSNLPAGDRFSHTLFTDPGRASVSSFHCRSADDSALIRYSADSKSVSAAERTFNGLMKYSAPLVEITPSAPSEKNGIAAGRLRLNISRSCVTISRTEAPLLDFRISHPIVCRAFRACLGGR